jgi:hypothetical protein
MTALFKKRSKKSEGIKLGVDYFIPGKDVVFDLNGLDFTFGKFDVTLTEDSLKIKVEDEAPMNLIYLLDAVKSTIDVDRKEIINADSVRFVLNLKNGTFSQMKSGLLKLNQINDIFQLDVDGKFPLKLFINYELEMYGTTTEWDE